MAVLLTHLDETEVQPANHPLDFGVVFVVVGGVLSLVSLRSESRVSFFVCPDCGPRPTCSLLSLLALTSRSASFIVERERKITGEVSSIFAVFAAVVPGKIFTSGPKSFTKVFQYLPRCGTVSACLPYCPLWPSVPISVSALASFGVGSALLRPGS